jgi:hypothetical protein
VSAARNALMNAGLIEALRSEDGSTVKRLTPSGNPAQAWTVTEAGQAYLHAANLAAATAA